MNKANIIQRNRREAIPMFFKKTLKVILLITATVFLIPTISFAVDGATCPFITFPINIVYPEGWHSSPTLYTSSEDVAPGNTVDAWVVSSVWPTPPYTWQISGTGFGLEKETTGTDYEINEVSAGSSACGSAEISVTNGAEEKTTGYVRSTNGTWRFDATLCSSKSPDYVCVGPAVGKYQYVVGYSGNPSSANCGQPCGAYYTANAAAMGLTPAGCVGCALPGKYYFTQTGCSDCTGSCGERCQRIKIEDISRRVWDCP